MGAETLPGDETTDLETIRAEVDEIADKLGKPIDPGIKETVVALKANGFSTSGSCEGHLDHGYPYPFVNISTPEPDGWQDNEVLQAQWRTRNMQQREKMELAVSEFNQGQPADRRIGFQDQGIFGAFIVQPAGDQPQSRPDLLDQYRATMGEFTRFLMARVGK